MSKNPMLDIKLIAAQAREMMFAPPVPVRRCVTCKKPAPNGYAVGHWLWYCGHKCQDEHEERLGE